MNLAFSVDVEPNPDGSIDGIETALTWYDSIVDRGTLFVTRDAAEALSEKIRSLSARHELGVHVHPREFGGESDLLADYPPSEQQRMISTTRRAICDSTGLARDATRSFRAGRHSINLKTLSILVELGFRLDASFNVKYDLPFPRTERLRNAPFIHRAGLVEVPTSHVLPPLLSWVGLGNIFDRRLTATASTVRADGLLVSGRRKLEYLLDSSPGPISMYMHPYDAITSTQWVDNGGAPFRSRIEQAFGGRDITFVSMIDVAELVEGGRLLDE